MARAILRYCLGIALLVGCAAPRPRYVVETPAGVVRAEDQSAPDETARALEELIPVVRRLVPHTRAVRPEVWVQRTLRLRRDQALPEQIQGFNTSQPGRIHILAESDSPRFTLAHELVHALLDASWDPLPGVIEEGLCEWVATRAVPGNSLRERSRRLFQAALYLGSLEGTLRVIHHQPEETSIRGEASVFFALGDTHPDPPVDALTLEGGFPDLLSGALKGAHYSLGYWIVLRILRENGLDQLHELCLEASREGRKLIPASRILEAARLPEDSSRWQDLILEEIGEAELREVAIEIRGDLAAGLIRAIKPFLSRELSGPGFVSSSEMAFSIKGHPISVTLTTIEEVNREILSRW